jgi:protein-S-isoprenylcysteine O-methyltransferase Ste14
VASRVWLVLVAVGALATIPVLVAGFRRRGTGVIYEHSFITQNLPRVLLAIGFLVAAAAFEAIPRVDGGVSAVDRGLARVPILARLVSVAGALPGDWAGALSLLGLALSASGLIFVVGGWYSLGRHFTPDVEIFADHTIHDGGLFRVVMHPAYSGFIQFFTGSALVLLSPLLLVLALGAGLPLAMHRARREEILLGERFGPRYTEFAQRRRWRRIVPTFVPFGF